MVSHRTKIILCVVGISVVVVVPIIACILDSCHIIDEGTVGVYYVHGALQNKIGKPGVAWKAPFVTTVEEVTIRPRTDTLGTVEAVTKDGITMEFKDMQILTDVRESNIVDLIHKFGKKFRKALVFDRIKEEVRIFAAGHDIDEVYNTKFLEMVEVVKTNVEKQIQRLSGGSVDILNLVIPKPDIPRDIAANYKAVSTYIFNVNIKYCRNNKILTI